MGEWEGRGGFFSGKRVREEKVRRSQLICLFMTVSDDCGMRE